jgi:hypothetical protein
MHGQTGQTTWQKPQRPHPRFRYRPEAFGRLGAAQKLISLVGVALLAGGADRRL